MSKKGNNYEIPKIIHFFWFGNNPFPKEYEEYIGSWEKYFPNYKIIKWDESNFDINNQCQYFDEAYNNKCWAFASDYARFKILYDYGGVYLDTDVEVIRTFDDLIQKGPFFGTERSLFGNYSVAPGLVMAFYPKHPLIKKILEHYEKTSFLVKNKPDFKNNVCKRVTRILKKLGYSTKKATNQTIGDVTIYSTDYFCPVDFFAREFATTENTRTNHHYAFTWADEKSKKNSDKLCRYIKKYGRKKGPFLWYLSLIPSLLINKLKRK